MTIQPKDYDTVKYLVNICKEFKLRIDPNAELNNYLWTINGGRNIPRTFAVYNNQLIWTEGGSTFGRDTKNKINSILRAQGYQIPKSPINKIKNKKIYVNGYQSEDDLIQLLKTLVIDNNK